MEGDNPCIGNPSSHCEKQQKEESSDESTIISSQTSTLTRNKGTLG